MRIGCIGLGDQGGAMAEMLLGAALPVCVWARRPAVSEAFRARGASVAETAAALAGGVDLLSLCVTTDADVEQVLLAGGVLAALRPGAVLAIHSTVRPELCERVAVLGAARGVQVLDAPVSGSSLAARNKSLVMMVGGDTGVLERVKDVFAAYANPIVHMGGSGSGMRAKLIHNLVAAAHLGIAARAFAAAHVLGLDPNRLRQAMLAGTARSFGIEAIARLAEPTRARHILALLGKDVELARATGLRSTVEPLFMLADHALAAMSGWADGNPGPLAS